jgi:hypothetical protein
VLIIHFRTQCNSRVYVQEIAQIEKLRVAAAQINERLAKFGVAPAVFAPLTDEDLASLEITKILTRRIRELQEFLADREPILKEYEEEAAAQELARKRAMETPVERLQREFAELQTLCAAQQRELKHHKARLAELEAHSANLSSAARHDPPAAAMPFAQENNLPPGAGPPPRPAARSMRNAATSLGRREQTPAAFGMPNVVEAGRDTSSPADFRRASAAKIWQCAFALKRRVFSIIIATTAATSSRCQTA